MLSKLVLLPLLVSLAGSAVAAPHGMDPTLMVRFTPCIHKNNFSDQRLYRLIRR
jgi:hypothetical protein